jgi:DNA-binding response OmpR family regulator
MLSYLSYLHILNYVFMLNHLSNIWLVDDDETEHVIFKEALNEIYPGIFITHIYNGEDLQKMLLHSQPDILFLDINMPHDGLSCLKWIREKKRFHKMPVVMYTGSHYYPDILFSYGFGATLCMLKPSDLRTFQNQLRQLFELNWENPAEITHIHFQDSCYRTFTANKKEGSGTTNSRLQFAP